MEATLRRISTPLRTILLEFTSRSASNPLEQEVIAKYEQLHHELFTLTSAWRKTKADARALRNPYERIKKELHALKQETKDYRSIIRQSPLPEEALELDAETLREYGEDVQYFFDVYQKSILGFLDDYKKVNDDNTRMLSLYEDFNANYYDKVAREYDNTTINLITFDEDFNEFNILMDALTDLIYKTADEYKIIFAQYEKIVKEMDDVFTSIGHFAEEASRLRGAN